MARTKTKRIKIMTKFISIRQVSLNLFVRFSFPMLQEYNGQKTAVSREIRNSALFSGAHLQVALLTTFGYKRLVCTTGLI